VPGSGRHVAGHAPIATATVIRNGHRVVRDIFAPNL
jgi:hypothetical protein